MSPNAMITLYSLRSIALVAAALATLLPACRSGIPPSGAEMAPHGADDPDDFEGELEEGNVYAATVRRDDTSGTYVLASPVAQEGAAEVRVDWANLEDFPALATRSAATARVVFEAISSEAPFDEDTEAGRVVWTCRLLRVQ